jgi:DNA-directed RNA polymerase specialized sigma subunit
MKVWLAAMAGLILFIGLAIFVQHGIQNTSKQFEQELDKVNITLAMRQRQPTITKLEAIEKKWQKTKLLWAMLIIHREIDSIDEAIIRTVKFTQSGQYQEAQVELSILKHYINHIPERERFSLVNIF